MFENHQKKSHLNLIINAVHPLVFTVIISMHIRCIDMKALGNDGWTLEINVARFAHNVLSIKMRPV